MARRIVRAFLLAVSMGALLTLAGIPGSVRVEQAPQPARPGDLQLLPRAEAQVAGSRGALLLGENVIADVAAKVTPSVVNVFSSKVVGRQMMRSPLGDPFFDFFFGPRRGREPPVERKQQSLGSGVVVTADGYILTNNHVVEDADEIRVGLNDGQEYKAKLVGTDPPSDLAVLKVEAKNLKPIAIGDSSKIRVGELVLAVGNPFGVGQTVTMGIISAVGRANTGIVDYEDFIQTDAAINPGNSGGALVDMKGELIGINTAIASRSGGYQGIGFAIPSQMAVSIKDSLISTGKVQRGWLGVSIQNVTQDLADGLGLTPGKGVLVGDVTRDSPADKAGIAREDVILAVDGTPTNDMGRLRTLIATKGKDAKVVLDVLRKGKEMRIPVVLGELPAELGGGRGEVSGAEMGALAGLKLVPTDRALQRKYDLPPDVQGLVVTGMDPEGPAAYSGLREGDVILEVNRSRVGKLSELKEAVGRSKRSVLLLIYRQGYTLFLTLRK